MSKHYNIILANAPINNGNRGCVALSITSIYIIHKLLKGNNISYKLYLPDSQFGDNLEHEININGEAIRYYDCSYSIGCTKKESFKIFLKNILKNRLNPNKIFKKADYIFDIGQGDSFADIYGEHRFCLIDRIHLLARKYKKNYCILPQTIGPFKNDNIKKKANKSIAKASLCMARDRQSYNYILKNVPKQKNVHECVDVAFFMPYKKIEQDPHYTHVGINISALLWNGGYTRNNQFGLKCNYQVIVREIINYFLSFTNIKVHLIPHVVLGERNIENDYEVSYEIWREYNNPNLLLAPFALGPIEIKSYIAGMDFFVGARMHATIGAFSSEVPVVPMAYSRKFNGLFLDTLQYHAMVDMKEQNSNEILTLIKKAFEKRKELKADIEQRMRGVVAEKKHLLNTKLSLLFNL